MTVSPKGEIGWSGEPDSAAFSTLEWNGSQLIMLQTVTSLA